MNCKPGDMAIVIRSGPASRNTLGKVITVTTATVNRYGEPAWYYSGERLWSDDFSVFASIAEDCFLCPIRPGDLHETEDDLNEVSA